MNNLKNTVALVTGASCRFGLYTSLRLLKQGAKVIMCDIKGRRQGKEEAKRHGEKSIFLKTNITSEDDVRKALEICSEKYQKLDLLVNCAQVPTKWDENYEYFNDRYPKTYNFQKDTPINLDNFTSVFQVNTVGTFNVIRLAVELMAKNQPDEDGQKGVIINRTSIQAFEGQSCHVAYAASSRAIASMTLPLARDLASEGIRCCTIATGFFSKSSLYDSHYGTFEPRKVSFKSEGCPSEFAHFVQTILENKMLNGEVIRLDKALRLQK